MILNRMNNSGAACKIIREDEYQFRSIEPWQSWDHREINEPLSSRFEIARVLSASPRFRYKFPVLLLSSELRAPSRSRGKPSLTFAFDVESMSTANNSVFRLSKIAIHLELRRLAVRSHVHDSAIQFFTRPVVYHFVCPRNLANTSREYKVNTMAATRPVFSSRIETSDSYRDYSFQSRRQSRDKRDARAKSDIKIARDRETWNFLSTNANRERRKLSGKKRNEQQIAVEFYVTAICE